MSARPFYETIYHVEGWTLADAFRPQPGWGTRTFTVPVAGLGEHTLEQLIAAAREHAPSRYRLTSVSIYEEGKERRVLWSIPPCATSAAIAESLALGVGLPDGAQRQACRYPHCGCLHQGGPGPCAAKVGADRAQRREE